jgi:hypothetical protein
MRARRYNRQRNNPSHFPPLSISIPATIQAWTMTRSYTGITNNFVAQIDRRLNIENSSSQHRPPGYDQRFTSWLFFHSHTHPINNKTSSNHHSAFFCAQPKNHSASLCNSHNIPNDSKVDNHPEYHTQSSPCFDALWTIPR